MRKFLVNVNGTSYEVQVEEIGGAAPAGRPAPRAAAPRMPARTPVARPAAPVAPAAPAPAPKAPAAPAAAPAASGAGQSVTAPMPGNVWKVPASVGQAVKKGDVLVILEAMKMENEILAPCDGTVVELKVAEGGTVSTGDVMVVIG